MRDHRLPVIPRLYLEKLQPFVHANTQEILDSQYGSQPSTYGQRFYERAKQVSVDLKELRREVEERLARET